MLSIEEADESFVAACASGSAAAEFAADAVVGTLDEPGTALNPWEPVVIVAIGPDLVSVGLWAADPDAIGVEVSDVDVSSGPVGDAVFWVAAEKSLSEVAQVRDKDWTEGEKKPGMRI